MAERLTKKITNKETGEVLLYRLKGQWGEIGDNRMRAAKKLGELEDAEEEGRLVVLPCKVGDALFCFSRRKIYPFKVRCIRIYEERVEIELRYAGYEENLKFWHITIMEQDVGSKFFLTREEAEKALREMEGK